MRRMLIARFGLAVALVLFGVSSAPAATDDFYRGKVIRIIVGFSAGGGFDTYARSLSRYMGNTSREIQVSSLRICREQAA